jgi:hypothetical protein
MYRAISRPELGERRQLAEARRELAMEVRENRQKLALNVAARVYARDHTEAAVANNAEIADDSVTIGRTGSEDVGAREDARYFAARIERGLTGWKVATPL